MKNVVHIHKKSLNLNRILILQHPHQVQNNMQSVLPEDRSSSQMYVMVTTKGLQCVCPGLHTSS